MTEELEIKKDSKMRDNKMVINDDLIDKVAHVVAEKAGISVSHAKTELGMGIILGMMMNKHRSQEIKSQRTDSDDK